MRKILFAHVAIFLGVLVFSCTTAGLKNTAEGPSGDLARVVREFYELKEHGRYDQAWNYERMSRDEDKERLEKSRRTYISRSSSGIALKHFEILEVGPEGSGPEGFTPVKIKLVTDWPSLPFPTPEGDRVMVMEDLWEKINGNWYHVVRGMSKFW